MKFVVVLFPFRTLLLRIILDFKKIQKKYYEQSLKWLTWSKNLLSRQDSFNHAKTLRFMAKCLFELKEIENAKSMAEEV